MAITYKKIVYEDDINTHAALTDIHSIARSVTLTVAANDATALEKAQADYVCDGVNDHVEIQAAIDALPATGGEVHLSSGKFNIEVSLVLDSYQTLKGCGRSTILTTTTAVTNIITATGGSGTEKVGILIADLCIDGSAGAVTNAYNIYFTYVDHSRITRVWSINSGIDGIAILNGDFNTITDNTCNSNSEKGIHLYESRRSIIANNQCYQNTNDGVYLDSSHYNLVIGNTCEGAGLDGLTLDGDSSYNILSSNLCKENGHYGIALYYHNDSNIIRDNTCIANSQSTTNTYSDIWIKESSHNNTQGNTCRAGTLVNKPKYGISINDATCNGNIVANNDLYDDGFGTAPYHDVGTGTIYVDPSDTKDAIAKKHTQNTDTDLDATFEATFVKHSLATAINDFLVASGASAFVKKTLAETKTILNWAADITTHAALTATHGVAGTIAGLADIVSYIATHAGLTTGVHGVGAGTIVANPLLADLNFAKFKAIAMACDNGATMPTSPVSGQWFLHSPTGRSILYQYNGAWIPYISMGSMTVYVDNTDGTNDLNHGTGVDANAFKTVQYAVNCIPGLVGGNVTIYLNNETYSEVVQIQGKFFTGSYYINIYGTFTELASATADSKTTGSAGTQGTLTDTGAFGSYDNKLVYITATGEYRVIDSDTADVITIAGCFADSTNLGYKIYDWGTTITSFTIIGQQNVRIMNIKTTSTVSLYAYSIISCYNCWLTAATAINLVTSYMDIYQSYISASIYGISAAQSRCLIYNTKIYTTASGGYCIRNIDCGSVFISSGTILDASTTTGTIGIYTIADSSSRTTGYSSTGYNIIRNQATGINALQGGVVWSTANNQYSGNTANETAVAASYGYID